jgi:hypothetical protein
MLDKVYHIDWLEDITAEEKKFAQKIMNQMNGDMKYPTEQDRHFTSEVIMNNIIFFKRIADKIELK